MRKLISITVIMLLLVSAAPSVIAQAKFGHINTNELLRQMPGRTEAQQELEKYARELEEMFVALQNEFQTKYTNYLENEANLSELIKQSRQRELQSLQERIMEFQESAQQDLVDRENKLLSPIIEKARKAIDDVAKENGYTYVFDLSTGAFLYAEPSDNIMPLVKSKLGIE
jgi:outer membrane protein